MTESAGSFSFDPELTPKSNVDAFFDHLAETNPKLTDLLRDNLPAMLERPEQVRSDARRDFNRAIAKALDEDKGSENKVS